MVATGTGVQSRLQCASVKQYSPGQQSAVVAQLVTPEAPSTGTSLGSQPLAGQLPVIVHTNDVLQYS